MRIQRATLLAATLALGFTLACTGTSVNVEGERGGRDDCLEDTVCWEPEPIKNDDGTFEPWVGLTFSGQSMYDIGVLQIGPVLDNGKFILDFGWPEGPYSTAGYEVEIVGDTLQATMNGDGQVVLLGTGAGSSQVRVVNEDGLLVDWLTIETVELIDIQVVKVGEDTPLVAGCSQMVGVRLVAGDVDEPLRAIDDDVEIFVDGEPAMPDPGVWDCFIYDVPADAIEVEFEVRAGGEVFTRTLPVTTEGACGE